MPLTRQQALDLFASDDLIGLGMEASAIRDRLVPTSVVTYMQRGEIAFSSASPLHAQTQSLTARVRALAGQGATSITCTATSSAGLELGAITAHLAAWRTECPHLTFAALTPAELIALSATHAIPTILSKLRDAGLTSLCATPTALDADTLAIHRAAHRAGIPTVAALLFEVDPDTSPTAESPAVNRFLDGLDAIRRLQQETGGFTALLITSEPAATIAEEPTAVATLKALAIARIAADNIPHITLDPPVLGPKLLQMALRFGADDAGALTLSAEGTRYSVTRSLTRATPPARPTGLPEEELRRIIRDAGFHPVERDLLFHTSFLQ